jgi:hypothetical protein
MSEGFYVTVASSLNFRSIANSSDPATIKSILPHGTVVEFIREADIPGWWEVHIVGVGSNETGFVARRYLAPVSSGTIPVFKSANSKLWDLSQQAVQAKVSYCLGHKAKNLSFSGQAISGGSIDCSGWVGFITRSAFEVINTSAAETVFDGSDISTLETHSDGIIAEIGKRTGKTLGGQEVAEINLREGMLIGFDSGQNKWESKDRTYGIDHIVQIVRSPDETLFITQSSGSGKGVRAC